MKEILHEYKKDAGRILRKMPSLLYFREQSAFTLVVLHGGPLILNNNLLIHSYCMSIAHYTAVILSPVIHNRTETSRYD